MAVPEEAYTEARYLIAGSVMTVMDQEWFTVDDVDSRACIYPSLQPEIESLEKMDICEKHFSAVDGKKYRLESKYFPDFRKINGYFNVEYGGNLRQAEKQFDEEDLSELKKEVDVIKLLS